MLDAFESAFFVVLIIAVSLGFLYLVHRFWPPEQRRPHNDLIGWQITVLGTTYAVIIGFMLYAVWTNFQMAAGNAEAEANCLVNVVRSAEGMPEASRTEIDRLASRYADVMLADEWPAMDKQDFRYAASHLIIRDLWRAVSSAQTQTAGQETSRDHTLTELSEMTDHRRVRHEQAESDLPFILWTVLIAGAVVTILSACLFGSADFKLHFIQVAALALMLALLLVTVADINRPFQGSVRVSPVAFERARVSLAEYVR